MNIASPYGAGAEFVAAGQRIANSPLAGDIALIGRDSGRIWKGNSNAFRSGLSTLWRQGELCAMRSQTFRERPVEPRRSPTSLGQSRGSPRSAATSAVISPTIAGPFRSASSTVDSLSPARRAMLTIIVAGV